MPLSPTLVSSRSAATLLLCLLGLSACGRTGQSEAELPPPAQPLRALAAARGRSIGGVAGSVLFKQEGGRSQLFKNLLANEFNMIWSGSFLKLSVLTPERGIYDFQWADSMVAFAQRNDMTVRGHVLVWHNSLPIWLTSGTWTSAQADSLLAAHIDTVMHRYKGKIRIWDVVNEALDDANPPTLRRSFWFSKLGADYLPRAFVLAHAADPTALLFYNDYNIEGFNSKSNAVYEQLKQLQAAGVPLHGLGIQGHLRVGRLPRKVEMLKNFARFAALGLTIQITELDIRIPLPVTPEKLAQQARDYQTVVEVCLETPACNAIELASVFDGESWVPSTFPGEGAAALYDERFTAKPAYRAVSDALGGR